MKNYLKNLFTWLTGNRFLLLSRANITYEKDLLYTYNNADFLSDPLFRQAYSHVKRLDTSGITGAASNGESMSFAGCIPCESPRR